MTHVFSKRSLRVAFPSLLLLTAMTLPPDPYKKIGQGGFPIDCTPQGGIFTTTCRNIPNVDLLMLTTQEQRAAAAIWIQSNERRWGTESAPSDRKNEQKFTIEANRVLKWVALKKINAWTHKMVVVSRIKADPKLQIDLRYNIGMQPGYRMSEYFYMAVRKYDASDPSQKYDSRKVSMWSTYGVATPDTGGKPQLVLLAQGIFRWCEIDHETPDDASYADFLTCKTARAIQTLETQPVHTVLRGRSLLNTFLAEVDSVVSAGVARGNGRQLSGRSPQARTSLSPAILAQYTRGVGTAEGTLGFALGTESINQLFGILRARNPDSPAWMSCGGGCCIAEDLSM